MDFALGAVTVLSLLMTIGMGVLTWRIVQEERRRSAARLAALADELKRRGALPLPEPERVAERREAGATDQTDAPDELGADPLEAFDPMTTPAASLDSGGAAKREAHADDAPPVAGPPPLPVPPSTDAAPAMFSDRFEWSSGWTQRLAGVGVAGVVLAALVSLAILAVPRSHEAAEEPSGTGPVELLALAHDRQDDALAISGTVRNPMGSTDQHALTVLATAFDETGAMVASGRAPLALPVLAAGAESTFTVSIPLESISASRYRISFLTDETTVPHLDRRTAEPRGPEETES